MNKVETPFYQQLIKIVDEEQVLLDEPLSRHTTFKTGGTAEYFVEIRDKEQLSEVIKYFKLIDRDYFVLGNGSNLLVSDNGYDGVIISLHKYMTDIKVEGSLVTAGAGALLSKVSKCAADAALTGLEFAAGIPGTVGGAMVMNAGAYGGEIKQVFREATIVSGDGEVMTLSPDEMGFGYRTSIFKKKPLICVQAVFELVPGNRDDIYARIDELAVQRREKQPLEYPSAGSTFKRPEGYFAGKLIMDAGLRGYQIGGARVSDKHCGFIINAGGATSADVKDLMDEVTIRVKERFDVTLEPEVIMLGKF